MPNNGTLGSIGRVSNVSNGISFGGTYSTAIFSDTASLGGRTGRSLSMQAIENAIDIEMQAAENERSISVHQDISQERFNDIPRCPSCDAIKEDGIFCHNDMCSMSLSNVELPPYTLRYWNPAISNVEMDFNRLVLNGRDAWLSTSH